MRWGRKGDFYSNYKTLHQTRAIKESLNPVWEESCELEIAKATANRAGEEEDHVLLFELWDEDPVTKTNLRCHPNQPNPDTPRPGRGCV